MNKMDMQAIRTTFDGRSQVCDEHAELLKNNFKPPVKKLKLSTLVAKSDLRFKVH